MPDYGRLYVDGGRLSGAIELKAVVGGVLSERVFAGRRDEVEECGKLEAHRLGVPLAQIYATNAPSGELRLRGETGAQGSSLYTGVLAGCSAPEGTPMRSGFVRVRAVGTDGAVDDVVRIATDAGHRGSVRLTDTDRPEVRATLEIDHDGPILFLTDGQRSIAITPRGIEQSPDKAGEPELAVPLPDRGPGMGAERAPRGIGRVPGARPDLPPPVFEVAFVAEHPADPTLQIHYNVLEGPEVGVYARGTARLTRGRALVKLPQHFGYVASETGLTVQLTPRSAESRGVAAPRLTATELAIQELGAGEGEYEVDWVVHGVRKGRERFEVVRPRRAVTMRDAMRAAAPLGGVELDDEGR